MIELRGIERTRTGAILLPDRGYGWGPIFWSVLDRVATTTAAATTEKGDIDDENDDENDDE